MKFFCESIRKIISEMRVGLILTTFLFLLTTAFFLLIFSFSKNNCQNLVKSGMFKKYPTLRPPAYNLKDIPDKISNLARNRKIEKTHSS